MGPWSRHMRSANNAQCLWHAGHIINLGPCGTRPSHPPPLPRQSLLLSACQMALGCPLWPPCHVADLQHNNSMLVPASRALCGAWPKKTRANC